VALGCLALNLQAASGTVTFGNNSACLVTNAQTGQPVSNSDNIRVALYWAPLGLNTLVQIGTAITNVGNPLPGIFAGGTRTTGVATSGGATAQFQVKAWGGGFATYEQAQQAGGALLGQSAIIQVPTGDPGGAPPTPPGFLNGLQSFVVSPPAALTVTILSPLLAGTNFTFSFSTISNQSYTVQQNTNLATTNWTFYTNITGNGSLYQFLCPVSTNQQKYFRLR
jgi:hypothetical protein